MNIGYARVLLAGALIASSATLDVSLPTVAARLGAYAPSLSTVSQSPSSAPPVVSSFADRTDLAPALVSSSPRALTESTSSAAFVKSYCATCHSERAKAGGLVLTTLDLENLPGDAEAWEKVLVKLRAGLMPPEGAARPDKSTIAGFSSWIEGELDRAWAARPNPGRTAPFHRLNRAEYRNAVRDLLALELDVSEVLPADEISYGFDNIGGVLRLSPLLVDRYLNVAQQVARQALGTPAPPIGVMVRVSDQLDQDIRLPGMPVGTRGGALVPFEAPRDGDYTIKVRLGRGLDEDIPHFLEDQHLEVSVDGEQVQVFTLSAADNIRTELNIERQVRSAPGASPPQGLGGGDGNGAGNEAFERRKLDEDWEVAVPLKAGRREIRATFIKKTNAFPEGYRRPFLRPFIGRGVPDVRETREGAALRTIEIMGPLNQGRASESPSYQRVFVCHPSAGEEEVACATKILSGLARRAYRRPVTEVDLEPLLAFFRQGRAEGTFEQGIEIALQRILVSPSFLFRAEFGPSEETGQAGPRAAAAPPGTYRISDVSLASRLSFFLWSSIPDDELLDLAIAGRLRETDVLEQQVRRMLDDPRSEALVKNFAGQWLYLRKLPDMMPDPFLFPDHGDTLNFAFEREAELFFESMVRENRPALEFLTADYTFVNERLALHYGITNVKGINFRRVQLADDSPRRGLLGKGAILTVTSFPNRTSPVVRGAWVLANILGAPPPEPPPNVPELEENTNLAKARTLRERLEQHRENPVCSSCHKLMDPLGFALENFDAIGKYRTYDDNFIPIDNSGVYPDGTRLDGVAGLRRALVNQADSFLANLTGKLLTYGLGRGVDHNDQPAIRTILREASPEDHRMQSLILGIVKSAPFQLRRIES